MPRYPFTKATKPILTASVLTVLCASALYACATVDATPAPQSPQAQAPITQAPAIIRSATQGQEATNPSPPRAVQFSSRVFYNFSNKTITGKILAQPDEYTDDLQALEIGIKNRDASKNTFADLQENYKTGALDWNPEESKALTLIISGLNEALGPYEKHLPSSIALGKISDRVEGGLPHTRGNMILFSQGSLDQYFATVGANQEEATKALEGLFLHELHHVMSRKNTNLHNDYYALLGFKPCAFTPPLTLKIQRLTNPDAPHYKHYAPLAIGQGDGVIPYLTVTGPYDVTKGESLGAYFNFGLLAVNEEKGICSVSGSKPTLLAPPQVPAFLDLIGRNTNYIIHPEETLADNFIYLIQGRESLTNPEIPEKIRTFWANQ